MPKKARNYRKEYDEYHGSAEQRANRAARNKCRRKALKEGKVTKGTKSNRSTQEIDHKVPLSKGGSKGCSNTKVTSRKANRTKYNKSGKGKK